MLAVQLVSLCWCAPSQLGIKLDKRDDALPTLTLPYGTYRAKSYNANGDVSLLAFLMHLALVDIRKLYVFKNIRFAAPPIGNLRWAKPAPPNQQSGVQDGSYGPVCVQAQASGSTGGIASTSFTPASEGNPNNR